MRKHISASNGAKLDEVLALLRDIESIKAKLKAMGVLRSHREAACDFAEWWAAKVYNLTLVANTVNPDYDATNASGRRYQIKERRVGNLDEPTSFNFRKTGEIRFPGGGIP